MKHLLKNKIYYGKSEERMLEIEPGSIALSFWSPPYFVGKEYERDATYDSWQTLLKRVIENHFSILKPGGFMVVNIADILCFKDESIPRFQAMNVQNQRCSITKEMIIAAKKKFPGYNRNQLAEYFGCSEQTIDRRVNGNNIRGGKHQAQTRVKLVGGNLEKYAYEAGLFLYDKRIWVKDPTWQNSRWTSNTLKAVSEYEDLYIFWKPGPQVINRARLTKAEWTEWGLRGVWRVSSVRANKEHVAQFPVKLAERVIKLYTDPNDTVLDPFMGGGTTALAAIKTKRNYIGIEKEKKYLELTECKIADYLKQPILLNV